MAQIDQSIANMSQIVKLNVGGKRYETSISTIMKYPNSLLGTMIQSPEIREKMQNDEELFIDRDGKMFEYILRYLRDPFSLPLPDDDYVFLKQLELEAKFFKLVGLEVIISQKFMWLVRDGWKIGDNVTERDLSGESARLHGARLHGNGCWFGTIVRFRMDRKVAVRFEYPDGHGPVMRFVTLVKQG